MWHAVEQHNTVEHAENQISWLISTPWTLGSGSQVRILLWNATNSGFEAKHASERRSRERVPSRDDHAFQWKASSITDENNSLAENDANKRWRGKFCFIFVWAICFILIGTRQTRESKQLNQRLAAVFLQQLVHLFLVLAYGPIHVR